MPFEAVPNWWRMRFYYGGTNFSAARLGVLAGSFNPPTIAHVELAEAARPHVDEIVCVVPGALPHKEFFGATLDERLELLSDCMKGIASAVAASEGGLLVEIARELERQYAPGTRFQFLCGRDAAERILTWNYSEPAALEELFKRAELLVAPRGGHLEAPAVWKHRIRTLAAACPDVSSTDVRERIVRGEAWGELVPPQIRQKVRAIYERTAGVFEK